ncbi:DUF4973 domain-containing protein [Dysgonomonas termitidis]|uniref:DUF4973 domain-containing protein n=1 Tax=Dysgonomonas termitidis TaxID=1516126 RepID=A0ABV9KQB5_9BACT
MKYIYYLFFAMFAAICCTSCNNEWEDEQYENFVSFKANPNTLGVTPIYVRYKAEGKVTYQLPLIMSGSKMNNMSWTINIGLDPDTLVLVNKEAFGHREELYFRQLETKHYEMPGSVGIPAGSYTSTIPIDFELAGLDQTYKWLLPLKILEDPSYQVNYHKYYQRAMLQVNPFNDYSGTYSGTLYQIYLLPDKTRPLNLSEVKTYVVDDETIFFYAGLRTEDFLDRKLYKIYARFTDERVDLRKRKLELYTDNPLINLKVEGVPYYTVDESMDPVKTYLKLIDINLGDLNYSFDDYTTIPGTPIRYSMSGILSMQRRLNTLIPDEDQQIQW